MIQIGVCQWILDRRGVDALHRAAELGFAGIQLGIGDEDTAVALRNPALQKIYLQAAEETGVEIVGIGISIMNKLPLHSPPDSDTGRCAWNVLRSALDTALAMGIGLVYCPSFFEGQIRTNEEFERASAMLRRGCEYIDGQPLQLAMENSLDAARHMRIIDLVDHPSLRVLIDGYNPVIFGHLAATLVRELPSSYLCNQMHAKDGHKNVMGSAPLGQGEGHFEAFVQALQAIEFDGWLICENNYNSNADELVAADLAVLRNLLGND